METIEIGKANNKNLIISGNLLFMYKSVFYINYGSDGFYYSDDQITTKINRVDISSNPIKIYLEHVDIFHGVLRVYNIEFINIKRSSLSSGPVELMISYRTSFPDLYLYSNKFEKLIEFLKMNIIYDSGN